jgi:hypothetical protein
MDVRIDLRTVVGPENIPFFLLHNCPASIRLRVFEFSSSGEFRMDKICFHAPACQLTSVSRFARKTISFSKIT